MEFSAIQPEGWRQALCGAVGKFVLTAIAYWMALLLGGGIVFMASAACLFLAWWFVAIRIVCIVMEAVAACFGPLSQVRTLMKICFYGQSTGSTIVKLLAYASWHVTAKWHR